MDNEVAMPKFKENEKVLCFHDKLLYEAKICGYKVDKRTKEKMYQIHFIGWSKKWDIWTKPDCILGWTRENLQKKDELEKESDDESSPKRHHPADSHRKRRRRSTSDMSLTDDESNNLLYDLPPIVWDILQADEKLSNQEGRALRYAINELAIVAMIDDFKSYRCEQLDATQLERTRDQICYLKSEINEFCTGLLALFDSLTPLQLLYQNDDQLPKHAKPSTTCSIIHFCRFLTRLTQNLQEILVKSDSAATLRPFFDLFLPWFADQLEAKKVKEQMSTYYSS